jgi:hypothetical protein
MRIQLSLFAIFIILFGFGSCSSTKYVVDYDSSVNFYRYSTYNFTPSADSIPINQMNKKRLFDALSQEMNRIDIRWSAEPDIYLHVHLMMKGKTTTNIAYGDGETINLGSGFSTTYMDMSEYSEGTIFFDIIDARRKNLVWTSRMTADIKGNTPLSEKEINQIVDKAFKKFPPKPPK